MIKFLSFPFLIAGFSGVLMAVQGALNSLLSQKTHLLAATLVVHIIGVIIALLTVVAVRIPIFQYNYTSIPWYIYLGGVLSVLIISLVAMSIPKIGMCNATTAIIIGQVGTALIIDHLGWLGVDRLPWNPWQILGLALFAAGAKLLFD